MPELEAALRRELREQPLPGPEVEARLRRAALEALPRSPRRGVPLAAFLRRRRIGPLAVAAALLVGGGALATALLTDGSTTDPRVGSFVDGAAAERFERTPALADSPWLSGPGGGAYSTRIDQVAPRPSLVFPPGTTLAAAVQSFYDAVSRRGELPPRTRLAAPLPRGRVVALPADGSAGIAIDLRAPFGYAVPSGVIRAPQIADTSEVDFPPPGRIGLELPVGVRLRTPELLSCQVMRGREAGPACRLTALPPGSPRAARGTTAMPDVRGLTLADALDELVRSRLGLYGDAGWVPAWPPEAHRRMIAGGAVLEAGADPPTVAEFREDGLEAFLRHPLGPGARGVLLAPGEGGSPGEVVAQHPGAGTRMRRGTPVVVAAVPDEECGAPGACAPGAAAARRRSPALTGVLPWLPEAPQATYRTAEPRPSLRFPRGTSHLEALRQLMVFVVARGELPTGATLGPPLPQGSSSALRPGERARRSTCARRSATTPRPAGSRGPRSSRSGRPAPPRCGPTFARDAQRLCRRCSAGSTSSARRSRPAR